MEKMSKFELFQELFINKLNELIIKIKLKTPKFKS